MDILTLFFVVLSSYTFWSFASLVNNYRLARGTGLPIVIHPVYSFNLPWLLLHNAAKPLLLRLPLHWRSLSFVRRADFGWTFNDRYATHAELKSDAFWTVSPGSNDLYVADPSAATEVMRRCRGSEAFIKRHDIYDALEVSGPSVNSVNGKTWERHRRITVPPFNEQVSEGVWDEAGRQAVAVKAMWMKEQKDGVRSMQEDFTKIALHVLTRAGFGLAYDFGGREEGKTEQALAEGHKVSYREALLMLLSNMPYVVLLRLIQKSQWPSWATWGTVRNVVDAHREFSTYLTKMVDDEKTKIREGESDRANLMSVLVRSSEKAREVEDAASDKGTPGVAIPGLTDQEMYGNLFMYSAAGHETTASTMAFALMIMATRPELQDWVAEEIEQVIGTGDEQDMVYDQVFPRLPRCLALMVC